MFLSTTQIKIIILRAGKAAATLAAFHFVLNLVGKAMHLRCVLASDWLHTDDTERQGLHTLEVNSNCCRTVTHWWCSVEVTDGVYPYECRMRNITFAINKKLSYWVYKFKKEGKRTGDLSLSLPYYEWIKISLTMQTCPVLPRVWCRMLFSVVTNSESILRWKAFGYASENYRDP